MSKREEIEKKTEDLVQPILDTGGYELVDIEYVKEGANRYLRIYADKEGGISIDDCVAISRSLEAKLDEEDFIEDAYILEVSSPGLGRPLKKEKDFARSIGKNVEVKLYQPMDGEKEMQGELIRYSADDVTILTGDQEKTIARNDIALIRLAFEF